MLSTTCGASSVPVRVHAAGELSALNSIGKLRGFGGDACRGIMLVLESLELGGIQRRHHEWSSIHGVEKRAIRVQQAQGHSHDLSWDGGDMAEGRIIANHGVRECGAVDGE